MPDSTLELSSEEIPVRALRLCLEGDAGGALDVPLSPGDAIVLGAGAGADVVLGDRAVSGRHCRVTHLGGAIEVTDLGSRNGVWVEGARVASACLALGMGFRIGRTEARLAPGFTGRELAPADAAPLPGLVGNSPPMRRLAASARRVAALRLPVLLRGESGTGKDLVARAIHDESPRARGPFVVLNAATISRELAESELFGHQRGAFTGASRDRRGAFREADGGTLFLDEIGALPADVQAKLLRVVEERTCRPLGGETAIAIDVRLVAATCEPLEAMVADRRFRADLYERIAVCVVHVPPLRDRPGDVAELARHLLATSELGDRRLTACAIALLRRQHWAGNVRELRNVVVQAAVRAGPQIDADAIASVVFERAAAARRRVAPAEAMRIFEETGRNVSAAARQAAIPRSTMRDLLRAARRREAPRAE